MVGLGEGTNNRSHPLLTAKTEPIVGCEMGLERTLTCENVTQQIMQGDY